MEKKLTTNDMQSLLYHVIRRIDRWWVEKTNLKQGYFTRSKIGDSLVTYKEYVEWRYSTTKDSKNYESIFISLDYEDSTDYIRIALRTMKNGVYAEYDPFCEIYDGKTEVVISEQTGFDPDNILRDVINTQDFDELTDTIADHVHMFVTPPDEEECDNMSNVTDLRSDPLIEFFCKFLKKYFVFIPNVAQQMNDMEYNEIETNVYFDEEGGFTIKANPDFKGSRPAPEFLFKKKHETYLINFNGEEDVMFIDFPKKTIAYLNEEKLEYQSRRFWSLFERELLGVEYKYPKNEYNGILPKTIYVFDTQYLENGALIQLYIKEDTDFSKKLGLTKGYYYNAMVVDHSIDKRVMMVQIHSKIEAKFVTEALWADVAKNKIDIIRKG